MDRLRGKTEDILRQRGIEQPEPIDPKIAIPAFEAASMESNENLQDLWANLFANAQDPTNGVSFRHIFIETLKQFEPIDALVLNAVVEVMELSGGPSFEDTAVCEKMTLRSGQVALSIQKLENLGCMTRRHVESILGTNQYIEDHFSVTPLGEELFIACHPDVEA